MGTLAWARFNPFKLWPESTFSMEGRGRKTINCLLHLFFLINSYNEKNSGQSVKVCNTMLENELESSNGMAEITV